MKQRFGKQTTKIERSCGHHSTVDPVLGAQSRLGLSEQSNGSRPNSSGHKDWARANLLGSAVSGFLDSLGIIPQVMNKNATGRYLRGAQDWVLDWHTHRLPLDYAYKCFFPQEVLL